MDRPKFTPVGVFVTGSIIRGNPNINSDFDIYVIHTQPSRQRIQKFFDNVPCEIFVNNAKHVYEYFEQDYLANRPVTAHMLATGNVVVGEHHQDVIQLIQSANDYLRRTPIVTDKIITAAKYSIAITFEDASDLIDTGQLTSLYFLNKLVIDIINFLFLVNGIQLPRPKDRIIYLKENLPKFGELISQYYQAETFISQYEVAKSMVFEITGAIGFFEWES